jgi:hypothetical protein
LRHDPCVPAACDLEVGDGARSALGRAVFCSLLLAGAGFGFTWVAKEVPALYGHEPWQDDPFDAVVSTALWCVPLLVCLCVARVALCRRFAPLPVRRALDVLQVTQVLVGAVVVTLASDWAGVLLNAHPGVWTGVTTALVCALAFVTALAVVSVGELRRAGGALAPRRADALDEPDWLGDAVALAERESVWLGPWRDGALHILGRLDAHVVARVRRHPLPAAAAFAVAFGVAIDTPQVVLEGYSPALAALFFAISACAVFSFTAIAGAYLRLVGRSERRPSRAAFAFVAACFSVPLSASLRGSLWWVIGTTDAEAGVTELAVLIAVFAVATGALALAIEPLVRRRSRSA